MDAVGEAQPEHDARVGRVDDAVVPWVGGAEVEAVHGLPVDVSTVPNVKYYDFALLIVDPVDDAIIACADTPTVSVA